VTGETVVTTPMIYTYWVVPKLRSDADQQNCISIGCDDGRCGWSDESCTNELPYICEHCTYVDIVHHHHHHYLAPVKAGDVLFSVACICLFVCL